MPIIAMTRQMGSLGTFIGMEAARQLGYKFIRQEIIQEEAPISASFMGDSQRKVPAAPFR